MVTEAVRRRLDLVGHRGTVNGHISRVDTSVVNLTFAGPSTLTRTKLQKDTGDPLSHPLVVSGSGTSVLGPSVRDPDLSFRVLDLWTEEWTET